MNGDRLSNGKEYPEKFSSGVMSRRMKHVAGKTRRTGCTIAMSIRIVTPPSMSKTPCR